MIHISLLPGRGHRDSEFTLDPSKVCVVVNGATHRPSGVIAGFIDDSPENPVQTNLRPLNWFICPRGVIILFDLSYRELLGGELKLDGISDAKGPIKLLPTKIVGDYFSRLDF